MAKKRTLGVEAGLFCDVLDLLGRRLGDRYAEPAVINEIVQLAGKLEEAWLKLPNVKQHAETDEVT
jgi:hypothetical protein